MTLEGELMRRSEALEAMIRLYNTIPDKATTFHKMDMLLSRLERIGLNPPATYMKGMSEVEGNKVVLTWDDEDEDVPYGKSVVKEVNADIKRINDIAISSAHTLTLEKLLTAKEKLSTIL
jgi:hypothetical protein